MRKGEDEDDEGDEPHKYVNGAVTKLVASSKMKLPGSVK